MCTILDRIDNLREESFTSLVRDDFGNLKIQNPPPTNAAGLYWIYTNYSEDDLSGATRDPQENRHVDISAMVQDCYDLPHACLIEKEGYRLVYNGIVGLRLGIRGRIGQHVNGGSGTGCLSILGSGLDDLSRWKVSYAVLELAQGPIDGLQSYDVCAKKLERMWRLKYGWPVLCTY